MGGIESKPIDYQRLSNALIQNLYPATLKNPPPDFFTGKMETFLTCRALAAYLRDNLWEKNFADALEEASLHAVQKTFMANVTLPEIRLLLDELPEILALDYPVVEDIHQICLQILPQIINVCCVNSLWRELRDMQYLESMLKSLQ